MTQVYTSQKLAEAGAGPTQRRDRIVGLWLLACAVMVLGMVVLGGITRLTGSGLSIMEWDPLMGAIPPLTHAEWERVFALYRTIPQYQNVNAGMSLAEFENIFWWEYTHRLWGRLLGVVFLLPFLWFLLRGYLRRSWAPRLAGFFVLGGLQGAIGWYMVASGFEERDAVSQYRLVLHLGMALILYALLLWSALDLLRPRRRLSDAGGVSLRRHGVVLLALVAVELTLGGLTAGLHGGLIYNDFPLMNGAWVAPDVFSMSPWWINPTENPVTAQFLHRLGALIVTVAALSFAWRARGIMPFYAGLLLAALGLQVSLGIATLVLVVPVPLAAAHQSGAVLLLTATLLALHGLKPEEKA